MHLVERLRAIWHDDGGAIISMEYMMLGGVVALGTAQGLTALRDATVDELKEMGSSIRSIRQTYTAPGIASPSASVSGSAATSTAPTSAAPTFNVPSSTAASLGICSVAP
jgi:hypothetical protein